MYVQLALAEYHKITCPTLKNMRIGCINFPKNFGLKILIVAIAPAERSSTAFYDVDRLLRTFCKAIFGPRWTQASFVTFD